MALIKCGECGKDISSKAQACPSCGAPPGTPSKAKKEPPKGKQPGCVTITLVIIFAFFAFKYWMQNDTPPPNVPVTQPIQAEVRIQELTEELKTIPASEYKQNLWRYQELRKLIPENNTYEEKVRFYSSKLEEKNLLTKIETTAEGNLSQLSSYYKRLNELYPDNLNYKEKSEYYLPLAKEAGRIEAEKAAKISAKKEKEHDRDIYWRLKTSSYFGDYSNGQIINKSGTIELKVYDMWQYHVRDRIPSNLQSTVLPYPRELTVTYDEIWRTEDDSNLTAAEKRKFKGQLNITELYWHDGKIQAYVIRKFFNGNPYTEEPNFTPSHKITTIYNRDAILKELK